jgi:hypothetical protein
VVVCLLRVASGKCEMHSMRPIRKQGATTIARAVRQSRTKGAASPALNPSAHRHFGER